MRVDLLRPGTYKALENHLREVSNDKGVGYYHVVHFDMHGSVLTYEQFQRLEAEHKKHANRYQYATSYARPSVTKYEGSSAFLFFEGEQDDGADGVEARVLANLLQRHQVPITILNACQSGKQVGASESSLGNLLVQAGVQLVLAMGYSVTVSAAELLMQTLYRELFRKNDLPTAIRSARQELYNNKERRAYFNQSIELEDWLLPVVYQNQSPRITLREFTPEESATYYQGKADAYPAPNTPYGFVGRDLDILQIEKLLLTKGNMVLIQGMGGAGKTTLLHHLGNWWQNTGLVERVFYFGYDQHAYTQQQLLVEIAKKLLPDPIQYVSQFQVLPTLAAQQAKLVELLNAKRHLLILDNLESITGESAALQLTLPKAEQDALKHLLHDLTGGRTLVLLGSRGREAWLGEGTFDTNVYELGGLDPEAASTLTDLILKRHRVEHYRKETDLQQLVKLLDGFPLALEVVLANLALQTPKEVLEALHSGGIDLNTGTSQERTENILRCIDYSHNNLSPEAQQLLLCLAPFTSVFFVNLLEPYITFLQQQPALSGLSFASLPKVLQESQTWGLLTPDSTIPDFLRLQPVLPYFLRTRLQAADQGEVRDAIHTAFRALYDQYAEQLYDLLMSKDAQERQLGKFFIAQEYENLMTALNIALAHNVSVQNCFFSVYHYLDAIQDASRHLVLSQHVQKQMERYSAEKLAGTLGYELFTVVHVLANSQLKLRQYQAAEVTYKRALALLAANTYLAKQTSKKVSSSVYHQIGIVAQEQRQWGQARGYFLQSLTIYSASQDTFSHGIVLRSLARLWQSSDDASIPAMVASILGMSQDEVEAMLRQAVENEPDESE